jgi:hypothetical protein
MQQIIMFIINDANTDIAIALIGSISKLKINKNKITWIHPEFPF